ncbi:hypothetical protein PENTCL1PPCAC_431, partial [Pristionchus entomophagus]
LPHVFNHWCIHTENGNESDDGDETSEGDGSESRLIRVLNPLLGRHMTTTGHRIVETEGKNYYTSEGIGSHCNCCSENIEGNSPEGRIGQ